MRKLFATATLAIFTCCALLGHAQDTSKPAAPAAKATAPDKKSDDTSKKNDDAKKDDDAPMKGRLPPQYGKLSLSDSQKQKIYSIQGSYATKLDELEAQIAAMKGKRDAEVEKVLTDDQRKLLKTLHETKEKADKDKGDKKDDAKDDKAAPAKAGK